MNLTLTTKDETKITDSTPLIEESQPGQTDTLHSYFCATCGKVVLITTKPIEKMPIRNTDESFIINMRRWLVKHYLKKDKLFVIKRDVNKYEKQFAFNCKECGVMVAFQCFDFEEEESTDMIKKKKEQIFMGGKKKMLYVLTDGVVADSNESLLFIEMKKIQEGKLNKDSHVKLKKFDIDSNGKVIQRLVYI